MSLFDRLRNPVANRSATAISAIPLLKQPKICVSEVLRSGIAPIAVAARLYERNVLARFEADACAEDSEVAVLARINNMAFEFMVTDGMEFDVAIRTAAEIVANCAVAVCEASYADVQALWRRISASGTAQAP